MTKKRAFVRVDVIVVFDDDGKTDLASQAIDQVDWYLSTGNSLEIEGMQVVGAVEDADQ